ncbi:myosin class II heavy chain (MHC) [Aspergillus flavus AF70]|nr:myosin class II heavy chain (MHC) [Aspergillus flavus AF70]
MPLDLDPSVSFANSAHSPPLHSIDTSHLRDDSLLAAPLTSSFTSPGASSLSTTGSPGRRNSFKGTSITSNPPSTLPTLPKYRAAWDSSTSSPENRKAESSIYYTTAWGSPYAAPSPRRLSWSLSQHAGIGRGSRDSSPISMRSGIYNGSETNNPELVLTSAPEEPTTHLHDSIRNRSPGRDIFGRRGGKSIKDFTQDWINQYLSGQPRTERSNWLSDDSGSEAPSFFTAQNHFADDLSDDWLGFEQDKREEDLLRTPTLADFANRRAGTGNGEGSAARQRTKEYLHRRAETLRQEDFWGFAYDKDPQTITMADTKEVQLPTEPGAKALPSVEKPLPPPPADALNENPLAMENTTNAEAKAVKTPVSDKPAQRIRKKVAWRGKACFVGLPPEDKRGSEESGHRLLTVEDVNRRLKSWEEKGYDVRGFSVGASEDYLNTELGGLSRPTWPDATEVQEEWNSRSYTVCFPNKAVWDAYVNFLQEEKLRALGVFLGDDEVQPSVSPASAAMSQMAPFPGLVSSPPIPTASAASNPLSLSHPFSPQLSQSTNARNGMGSLTSPASQFGVQTPFLGVDQNLLPGYHIPFQPTPPAQGSLTPQSFFNARQAGAASTLAGTLPNLTSILSPVSPLNEQNAFHPGLNEQSGLPKETFGDNMGYDMQDNMTEGQLLRPIRTPTENPDNFHASTVEIAHPTPRGHSRGHNLSETLQKGLDQYAQSEYHLEESINRQLDEGDREPHGFNSSDILKSRWALPENTNHDIQHLPQHVHQYYGGAYPGDNAQEGSDIDTNPSLSGTPHGPLANHIPWHEPKPSAGSYGGGHRSKLSSSTLNVDAKEFDPTAPSSQAFQYQDNSFQFPAAGHPMFAFGSGAGFKQPAGSFNVTAPSFTPGSFNVAAPVFNPTNNHYSADPEQSSGGRTKIFDDVDLSQAQKLTKKSKAIPIVRPDDNEANQYNEEAAENENGRSAAPTDRHKRARRSLEGPDGGAQISVSHALSENINAQATQSSNTTHVSAGGKENTSPDKDGVNSVEREVVPAQDRKPQERKDTPVSEASTWMPSDTKDESADARADTLEQNQAATTQPGPEEAGDEKTDPKQSLAVEAGTPFIVPKEKEQPMEETTDTRLNGSVLSADAKPFEFKPSVPDFIPVVVEQPKTSPEDVVKKGDIMASQNAVASSPAAHKEDVVPIEPTQSGTDPSGDELRTGAPQSERGVGRESEEESMDDAELNAVMEQLNEDSDVGIERLSTPHPTNRFPESVLGPSKEKRHVHAEIRSEAPSPSPGRGQMSQALNVPKLDFDAQSQFSATPSKNFASTIHSPIRQLVSRNDHISDWDSVISSGEDEKLANRSRFFDRRIHELVGSVVEERLSPLERALIAIENSISTITFGGSQNKWSWSASVEGEESDADDEEEYEEDASYRERSPARQRGRKFDKLKNVVLEALASRDAQHAAEKPANSEFAQLQQSVTDLQALTLKKLSQDSTTDLREMIEEVVSAQFSQQKPRASEAEEIGADSLMLQIDGLKEMLRVSDERAEEEYKKRREAQDSVVELQHLLKVSEDNAARHSEAAESAETRLLQFKEEKIPYFEQVQSRSDALEQEHAKLKLTLAEISSKNISLEGTLDEYRFSSDHWKQESEQSKAQIEEMKIENKDLRVTIDHMKSRIEDGLSVRQNLSEKFDRLQDEMATVTRDITRDQASWRKRQEEHVARYNELQAAYNREVKLREKLEVDISELEQQEREAAKLKFIFGQSQQENARLEELVANLRIENHDLEIKAARFEREFNEARESSRVEIQRTRSSLETDVEAANSQVNIVRAELEAQILRLQGQLDSVRLDSDTAQQRYEMLLEEANETKASAVASMANTHELAMEEQRKLHERILNDLRERHARALHNASEDRQRAESHLTERLELSEDKAKHLQDRVHHLEERLEIAQSAARAAAEAAQAAQAAKAAPVASSSAHSTSPSLSFSEGTMVPEKISPQALRESILVLQDQLQQRETRIEELEQEVASFDKDAPNKLKEKDTEITWLRELLGVRIDDLQDIIRTLSQPSFDHNTVRDAAIRLKANLQMQQQEKERASSGQSFPSFPSLSELTASPRSLPLAAAAAWGNWRRGRETPNTGTSEQTPSKPSNATAFLSGLLTPPGSNARQATPNATAPVTRGWRQPSESRPLRGYDTTPRQTSARASRMQELPRTPPLLRRSSYDHDAEPTDYGEGSWAEENESTADGLVSASPKETGDGPFGPQIAS